MNRFSERNQVTFIDENELQNNSNSNNEWEQCRGYDDDLQLVEYVENLKEKRGRILLDAISTVQRKSGGKYLWRSTLV